MTQNPVLNTTWQSLNPSNSPGLQENALTHQNITYVDFYLHKPSVAAVFTISYLLIFAVCMVGNGVVCFIVLRSKNMRTVTNLFILNLAISDLLVGIFCMPTTLVDNIITGLLMKFLNVGLIVTIKLFVHSVCLYVLTLNNFNCIALFCRMALW